ncbi:hypothetical protein NPS46_09645 [Pseudomonas putida]|uniref:hypothetical protein n=1 Tax=Pseudomonas putida TaxID=303 RepID=UPI00236325F9|nr:hypothetical protein [Pseudomonas putida]MDD2052803.1 hypothetical protein [Pseudomonas putida]
MKQTLDRSPERSRLPAAVAARAVLAILGGYAFAALAAASLSVALPGPRPQAVMGATMLAFVLYCAMAIWAFAAASVARAWWVALMCAALPATHLLIREALQ